MISSFFINRPVLSAVISIIITLTGLVALRSLPIEQYPNIVPPQIQVTANYPGADAYTVSQNIAAPLEQQINGVENMIYMYSQSSASGDLSLSVYFDIGSNADMAQVNVQNRVNTALPSLPEEVQRTGVVVQKKTPTILMVVALQSPDGRYDEIFTSNYATINIMEDLLRLQGISDVNIIGARDYSMRLWLRPDRMAELELTTTDVVQAVRGQNAQYAIGRIGQQPMANPVQMTIPVTAKGRLDTPEEFDNIVIRANADGSMVLLKDIGHSELGALNYDVNGRLNAKPTTLMAIYLQYGANALDVAERVKAEMERISQGFPVGLKYSIPYDTTKFIKRSITEVATTIFEAAALVVIVVFIFLQNLRATLIPVLAMLVSIIGTFTGLYFLGFSLNTLTLFGLVLSVGIVVDDAIVVIENVERNMREFGYSAKEAALRAMEEVTGPIIAIVFVLCAVFVPVAFLGGIAGQLYKQFAITISISVILSGIVALTLSPSLAAVLLKHNSKPSRFGIWFNTWFDKLTNIYLKGASWIIHRSIIGVILFATICASLVWLYMTVPTSFVPAEDQGYGIAVVNLPDAASLSRTDAVTERVVEIALKNPGMQDVVSLTGFSLLDGLPRTSVGVNFLSFKDWSLRKSPELSAQGILNTLSGEFSKIKEAQVFAFNPPSIHGLGTVSGFEFWVQNRGGSGLSDLENKTNEILALAKKRPDLTNLSSSIQANSMQLFIDLDRYKARSLGVDVENVFETLQVLLGSVYINDFNKFGRVYHVTAQAEPRFRNKVEDIGEIYVRSNTGEMVPLKSLVTVKYISGPSFVSRFNGFTASKIIGSAAPGYSSGEAMDTIQNVADEVLPEEMTYSWGGESFQEKSTGGSSSFMLIGGLIMVFLILSALYERWTLPLAILLAVPFGLFGAFLAVWFRGLSNDVYFQIGLVTLVALTAKNAILIVEFAMLKRQSGMPIIDAALEAARLRFRAILMTSFTFIFGVIPLVISQGAGAASRHSVGTGVLGGMIMATLLAIFFVPLFFKLIEQRNQLENPKAETKKTDD